MALNFKVETLPEKLVIHVKGNMIELSYHAASCLCRNIIEACEERQEMKSRKFRYWMERLRKGREARPQAKNREQYEKFLSSLGDDMKPSQHAATSSKMASSKEPEAERKAKMQAKIRELQTRYHITPRKRQEDDGHG